MDRSDSINNLAQENPAKVEKMEKELQAECSPLHENDRAEQFINQQLEHIKEISEQESRGDA